MRSHQAEFSIEKMAQVLKVSRSGFYRPSKEEKELYDKEIQQVFKEHKGRYGSPRIQAELKRRGMDCSRYKVEKRMKKLGLYSGKKKRKPRTTVPRGEEKIYLNEILKPSCRMRNGVLTYRIFQFEDYLCI